MDVQTITGHAFSVYISSDELIRRNIDPASVSYETAKSIITPLLDDETGSVQLDLFPGKSDLLIFVRHDAGFPVFFGFADSEELIEAVCAYDGNEPSALFYLDGEYVLAVWSTESFPAFFAEFGDPLRLPPDYLLHLAEHGKTLIECDAVYRLRDAFS